MEIPIKLRVKAKKEEVFEQSPLASGDIQEAMQVSKGWKLEEPQPTEQDAT